MQDAQEGNVNFVLCCVPSTKEEAQKPAFLLMQTK